MPGLPPPAVEPAVTSIKQEDLIQSVADALQYISYYHPVDYIKNLAAAYEREESPAAKDAIAQILINSRMCAEGHRPICQDTGTANVFLEIGVGTRLDLQESLDFAAQGKVRATVHQGKLEDINDIFAKMHKGQIEGRIVLDMAA